MDVLTPYFSLPHQHSPFKVLILICLAINAPHMQQVWFLILFYCVALTQLAGQVRVRESSLYHCLRLSFTVQWWKLLYGSFRFRVMVRLWLLGIILLFWLIPSSTCTDVKRRSVTKLSIYATKKCNMVIQVHISSLPGITVLCNLCAEHRRWYGRPSLQPRSGRRHRPLPP